MRKASLRLGVLAAALILAGALNTAWSQVSVHSQSPSLGVVRGQAVSNTIYAHSLTGFSQLVTFSVSSPLPPGMAASFSEELVYGPEYLPLLKAAILKNYKGERRQARQAWERALQVEPGNEQVLSFVRMLQSAAPKL